MVFRAGYRQENSGILVKYSTRRTGISFGVSLPLVSIVPTMFLDLISI